MTGGLSYGNILLLRQSSFIFFLILKETKYMSEKRRDNRGRILHNGEVQLSDGRYRFKYVDEVLCFFHSCIF